MKNLLAFGASNSSKSINKKLAIYASQQFTDYHTTILSLQDYDCPLFSIDRLESTGIPAEVQTFYNHFISADFIIISFAEHNGSYSVGFKNLFDWVTRIKGDFLAEKKLFLMSTSEGARGGLTVLETAMQRLPYHGAHILATFNFPYFSQNFDDIQGIIDNALKLQFESKIHHIKEHL